MPHGVNDEANKARALALLGEGKTIAEVMVELDVARSTVSTWKKAGLTTESITGLQDGAEVLVQKFPRAVPSLSTPRRP